MKKTKKPRGRTYDYTDSFRVARFEKTYSRPKRFVPEHKVKGKWITGDPPKPLPLYKRDELADEDTVIVVEGEKCADAVREHSFCATTSAHGSASPHLTDWSPLAGKTVIIIPDNDDAGLGYRDKVATLLAQLNAPVEIKVVDVSSWGVGRDIADVLDGKRGKYGKKNQIQKILSRAEPFAPPKATPTRKVGGRNNHLTSEAGKLRDKGYEGEALLTKLHEINKRSCNPPLSDKEVQRIALGMSRYPSGKAPITAKTYEPFPLDALPQPLRSYAAEGAWALGCDPAMVAVPLLVALASAIGNTTRLCMKGTWIEPAILWAAIVGESGTLKSPAIELALKFVNLAEKRERGTHRKAMAAFEDVKKKYDAELEAWKKAKSRAKPPKEPRAPKQKRYTCSDVTMEALAVLLMEQARGLLLYRDELAGWIETFDRYASGSGDVAHWLALFGGRTLVVDRKTGETKSITVPAASVCVVGGIQPETLYRVIGKKHIENGLLPRVLVTNPPPRRKRWTEAVIDRRTNQAMAEVFEGLYAIRMRVDKQGEPEPYVMDFRKSGKDAWVEFYNVHADESFLLTGDEGKVAAKLEGYVARLALTIHMVRRVSDLELLEAPDAVDAKSVNAAVELAKWFQHEARRVYSIMWESEDQRDTRQHIEAIRRNEGRITANDLCRSTRRFEESEDAEAFLNRLEQAGMGEWKKKKTTAKGGRPTRVFILKEDVTVTQTHGNMEGLGYGSATKTETDGTWSFADAFREAFKYNRRWGYIQKKGA